MWAVSSMPHQKPRGYSVAPPPSYRRRHQICVLSYDSSCLSPSPTVCSASPTVCSASPTVCSPSPTVCSPSPAVCSPSPLLSVSQPHSPHYFLCLCSFRDCANQEVKHSQLGNTNICQSRKHSPVNQNPDKLAHILGRSGRQLLFWHGPGG